MHTVEVVSQNRKAVGFRKSLSRHRAVPQHVAAVCYRVREQEIEFLLVQSRAGRWTFPKGRVEDDLTRAAAAAREAVEEAGAYGRVDMRPFLQYIHAKNPELHVSPQEHLVDAHLCEVIDIEAPEETYRNPTWFAVEKAKSRLHDKRLPFYGRELTNVVEHALKHIRRRHASRRPRLSMA